MTCTSIAVGQHPSEIKFYGGLLIPGLSPDQSTIQRVKKTPKYKGTDGHDFLRMVAVYKHTISLKREVSKIGIRIRRLEQSTGPVQCAYAQQICVYSNLDTKT